MKIRLRNGEVDADLRALVAAVWTSRSVRYSEVRFQHSEGGRKFQMFQVGG